jgi:hypothetical protein
MSTTPAPTPPAPTSNVQAVIVDAGPANMMYAAVDTLYVTLTVCAHGSTTNCQTIDHVQVDTGSYGLRILSSVLSPTVAAALTPQTVNGNPLVECTVFADGYSWGPIKIADMQVASETASGIPIQIIGDPAYAQVPSDCSGNLTQEDTIDTFGANGIIGIGVFLQDCGSGCTTGPQSAAYYSCPTSATCQDTTVPLAQQVSNPVASFATDNNGVIIELPSIASGGATNVTGSLIFGVGTQSNNGLGNATVYTVDPNTGNLTVNFQGTPLPDSFLDSGSNAFYFTDANIVACPSTSPTAPGFYCPSSTQSLMATVQGTNGTSTPVSFSIANAEMLFGQNQTATAFNNLGAPSTDASGFTLGSSFDLGLPFFFGRTIFTVIETKNTSGGVGPYFAF